MQTMMSGLALVGMVCVQAGAWNNVKFLDSLQPGNVAQTLVEVEKEWQEQVASFVACGSSDSACLGASRAFEKSCTEVLNSVVKGSSGDKDVVRDYWTDVCGDIVNDEEHKNQCEMLGSVMDSGMSPSPALNRLSFGALDTCQEIFSRLVRSAKEQAVAEKAIVDRATAEKAEPENTVAENATAQQAVAEKVVVEKAAEEKVAIPKSAVANVAVEKVAANTTSSANTISVKQAERGVSSNSAQTVSETAHRNTATAEQAVAEKAIADKATTEKAESENAAAESATAEAERGVSTKSAQTVVAEKAIADKAAEEKVATAKSVVANVAVEKVAAKTTSSANTITVKQAKLGVSSKSLRAEEAHTNTATVQQDVPREGETVVEQEPKKRAIVDKATVAAQDARVKKMMKEVEATKRKAHETMKKADMTIKTAAQAKKASKPIAPTMTLSKQNGVVAAEKSQIVSESVPLKKAGAGHASWSSSTVKK